MVQATERATMLASRQAFDRIPCEWSSGDRCVLLPLGVVRFGAGYWLFSELGELIGQIAKVEHRPMFGQNAPTVYLRR